MKNGKRRSRRGESICVLVLVCMLREEMQWLVKARVEDGDQGKIIFLLVLEI